MHSADLGRRISPLCRLPGLLLPLPVYNKVTRADDLSVKLSIDPFQPGINTFTVTITSGGKLVTRR